MSCDFPGATELHHSQTIGLCNLDFDVLMSEYALSGHQRWAGFFGKNFRVLTYRLCGDLQSFPSSAISNSSSSSVVKAVWQKYAAKIWENNETVHTFEEKLRLLDYTLDIGSIIRLREV
uniref:Uncharacterized protein n=1 Tax=Glossina pallidipes TaxID=7398 RepID=A0A1A9Z6A4_GLOPL